MKSAPPRPRKTFAFPSPKNVSLKADPLAPSISLSVSISDSSASATRLFGRSITTAIGALS